MITITLTQGERDALDCMAESDIRSPKEEVRALIRAEAERRGIEVGDVVADEWPVE